jgi:hypothetical protein
MTLNRADRDKLQGFVDRDNYPCEDIPVGGSHTSLKTKTNCVRRELLYAVAVMLVREASKHCRQNVARHVLRPTIEKHLKAGRPYIRIGNLMVTSVPRECLDAGKSQLFQHMHEVASAASWLDEVYGVIVIDDTHAEYYVLKRGGEPELRTKGDPGEVAAAALTALCAGKIPVVSPEDVAVIFSV